VAAGRASFPISHLGSDQQLKHAGMTVSVWHGHEPTQILRGQPLGVEGRLLTPNTQYVNQLFLLEFHHLAKALGEFDSRHHEQGFQDQLLGPREPRALSILTCHM
jgi:hypothetical protein